LGGQGNLLAFFQKENSLHFATDKISFTYSCWNNDILFSFIVYDTSELKVVQRLVIGYSSSSSLEISGVKRGKANRWSAETAG